MTNIKDMSYSEFVGLINERNRPSGGIKTVQEVAINARVNERSQVLEIGSNTGFTTVNLSLLTGASVTGIDMIQESINKSKDYAEKMGAQEVEFICANALELPFDDSSFDLVWCSNVTSFIENKDQAIREYLRVLKPKGVLAIVPIYYRVEPPVEIVKEVSKAIGCKIDVWSKEFWIDLFRDTGSEIGVSLEMFYCKDYKYLNQEKRIDSYVESLVKNNLNETFLDEQNLKEIKKHANYFYSLFNENNYKYAGYSTILMQKRNALDEEELFISEEV